MANALADIVEDVLLCSILEKDLEYDPSRCVFKHDQIGTSFCKNSMDASIQLANTNTINFIGIPAWATS